MTPYYDEDGITIYHEDCREVLPELEPGPRLAFADPPYGVGYKYGEAYEDTGDEDYLPLVLGAFKELTRIAQTVCVTPGMRFAYAYPPPKWMLAWFKPGSTRQSSLGGFNEWEPILLYGENKRMYHDALRLPDAANHAVGPASEHPCPKPLRLLTWIVENLSDVGDTVIDPFAGSGTTLHAAKQLNRKAIGIEIEERYCEIAVQRLARGVLEFG